MKVYTQNEVKALIDSIACYYSKTGDNSFDSGVNETVKEISKTVLKFEKEKGMDALKYNTNLFSGNC